jgi:hypothetical protein
MASLPRADVFDPAEIAVVLYISLDCQKVGVDMRLRVSASVPYERS